MRFMVFVKATKNSEAGVMPDEKLLQDMTAYNEALVKAGVMVAGDGLKPSSAGVRVTFSGDQRTVTRGPFGSPNDLVAGFWIWECASLEEAIEWAKKCPNPMPGETSDLEIRPFYEAEDFAGLDPSGEIRAREEAMRQELEARQ